MSLPQFTAASSLGTTGGYGTGGLNPGSGLAYLIGRWHIPWTGCDISCIEVCTRFCSPTGWDCCGWETRCVLVCDGQAIGGIGWPKTQLF